MSYLDLYSRLQYPPGLPTAIVGGILAVVIWFSGRPK
jgi:hypothetical protein